MQAEILFIKTSSLGDVVHHMPAVTDARRYLPQARLSWVVEEAYAPLARLHPGVDEVIPVATRRWRASSVEPATWRDIGRFRDAIRARAYDAVIDTQGLLRTAVIAKSVRGPGTAMASAASGSRSRACSTTFAIRSHGAPTLSRATARYAASPSATRRSRRSTTGSIAPPSRAGAGEGREAVCGADPCHRPAGQAVARSSIGSRWRAACAIAASTWCCHGAPTRSAHRARRSRQRRACRRGAGPPAAR